MLTNHSSFILFDLIILQRPIGFLSIEISSVNIREIKLLVLPRETRQKSWAELNRAPRASWLTLSPDRLSVMSQPSAAAGFKMHSGFGLWISSLQSRCQTFARPLGPCLLAPHSAVCFPSSGTITDWILDDQEAWCNTNTCVRETFTSAETEEGLWLAVFWYFLWYRTMLLSPLKDELFDKSHFQTLYIQVDALFKDFIISSSLHLILKLANIHSVQVNHQKRWLFCVSCNNKDRESLVA